MHWFLRVDSYSIVFLDAGYFLASTHSVLAFAVICFTIFFFNSVSGSPEQTLFNENFPSEVRSTQAGGGLAGLEQARGAPLVGRWYRIYHYGMRVTIDKAGRVVIPKPLRDRFNLHPGAAMEIEAEAEGFRLTVEPAGTSLIRKKGVLIHHAPERVELDVAAFLEGQRDRRNSEQVAEEPS